jgi:hypothetical protein
MQIPLVARILRDMTHSYRECPQGRAHPFCPVRCPARALASIAVVVLETVVILAEDACPHSQIVR